MSGKHKGSIEHRYGGKQRVTLSASDRALAQLLLQEAQIRRDFGEEGVKRFWEEVNAQGDDKDDMIDKPMF